MKIKLFLLLFVFFNLIVKAQKTIRYDLTIKDTIVNYTGKTKKAFSVNGKIPMPTLTFTEGDTALIYIYNKLKKKTTSLHWHGIILPSQYDGVDYINSAPIKAGETVVYKFPIIQNGTYWYHSHTGFQEQDGMYGAFIIHKRNEKQLLPEYTVLLGDWTNANSKDVMRRLYFGEDWFSIQKNKIQKGATQSYWDALKQGYLGTKLKNEWKRMEAMDVSDIYYDIVTINGKKEDQCLLPLYSGDKIKLRLINGGSSSYFWINYAGGKMSVVATDGKEVQPVSVDRLIIGIGETYDVIVTIPDNKSYQLLATTEDRTRSTSLWLGNGEKHYAESLKPLKYFEGMKMMNGMMKMNGNLEKSHMDMSLQKMDMNAVMYPEISPEPKRNQNNGKMNEEKNTMDQNTMHRSNHDSENVESHMANMGSMKQSMHHISNTTLSSTPVTLNYTNLKSVVPIILPEGPVKELKFELTGNMNRYLWAINNKTVSESDKILIKKGEKIKITLYNNTMMRHPMHLHGHFFRILNGQGEYSPLKHTIDIMPMETDTIEFEASESGDWFFHCHILYHMMSGMGRVFSYVNSPKNPQLHDPKMDWKMFTMMDKMKRFMIQNEVSNQGNIGKARLENKRWGTQTEWKLAYKSDPGYDVEARFGRYIGKMQWFFPYIGYNFSYNRGKKDKNIFGQKYTDDTRNLFTAGFRYLLPMRVFLDARVSHDGEVTMKLEKEGMVIAPRIRMDLLINNHLDFTTRAKYILTKTTSISGFYDSKMKWGAGLTFRY